MSCDDCGDHYNLLRQFISAFASLISIIKSSNHQIVQAKPKLSVHVSQQLLLCPKLFLWNIYSINYTFSKPASPNKKDASCPVFATLRSSPKYFLLLFHALRSWNLKHACTLLRISFNKIGTDILSFTNVKIWNVCQEVNLQHQGRSSTCIW